MKRQIHIDRIRFDALLAGLGGFAELKVVPRRTERIRRMLHTGRSVADIAEHEHITKDSVRVLRWRMGIRKWKQQPWSAADIARIFTLRAEGNTFRKIARILGRGEMATYQAWAREKRKRLRRGQAA